jgi:hypothetical protein
MVRTRSYFARQQYSKANRARPPPDVLSDTELGSQCECLIASYNRRVRVCQGPIG